MSESSTSATRHVLLVEDNEHDRVAFRRALRKSKINCHISECQKAEAALELLQSDGKSFDLVVIDFGLPGMSGLELYKKARAGGKQTPFVMLTGSGSEHLAAQALKSGVSDYIVKDPAQGYLQLLPAVIQEVLQKHEDRLARQRAEEALRESEQLHRELAKVLETERGTLQAIIDSLPVGLWIADAEGRIISVNEIAHAIWRGAPLPESVEDYTVYKAWWADTRKPIIAEEMPMARSLRGETCRNVAVDIERFDGTLGTQIMSSAPIKTSSGAITGCVAIAQDITDLKRAEEALRKAREELEFRVRERTAELEEANQILRDKERALKSLSNRILSAHEEERKRISRELHDSISSSLTLIKLSLENSLGQSQELSGPLSNSLKFLAATVSETIDETRRIMSDLRPSVLDDLGIVTAIEWICRKFRTTYPNIQIKELLQIDQERMPESLKIAVFRIIQEALQNTAKHSRAEFVDVTLRENAGQIELLVEDKGIGFDPEAILSKQERGLGLSTMRERAELSGGSFEIDSTAGEGTSIRASWPLE